MPLPRRQTDYQLCRVCSVPLMTSAEEAIGVHIACVAEKKFKAVTIKRPAYRTPRVEGASGGDVAATGAGAKPQADAPAFSTTSLIRARRERRRKAQAGFVR